MAQPSLRWRWAAPALPILFALAAVVYWGAGSHDRLPEDSQAVWSNPAVVGPNLSDAFLGRFYTASRDGARPVVRPAATLWLRALAGVFHQERAGFIWANIFLLAAGAWLFFLVLHREVGSPAAALAAALLLVAHPLLTAPVLTVAGSALLLALVFLLLGMLVAGLALDLAPRSAALPALAWACWLLAGWSHEAALAAMPALVVWIASRPGVRPPEGGGGRSAWGGGGAVPDGGPGGATTARRGLPPALLLAAGAAGVMLAVLLYRLVSLGAVPEGGGQVPAVTETTGLEVGRRLLLGLGAVPTALRLLVFPSRLGYSHDSLLLAEDVAVRATAGAAILLAVFGGFVWALARRSRAAAWAAWSFLGLLAASNLPFATGRFLETRSLALVLVPALAAVAAGYLDLRRRLLPARADGSWSRGKPRSGKPVADAVVLVVALAAVGLLGVRAGRRVDDYGKWETLARAQVETFPRSAEGHFDLGNIYLTRRLWAGATAEYSRAVELRPTHWMAVMNLGAAYFGGQEPGLALRAYDRVLEGIRGKPEWVTVEGRAEYNRALVLMQQNRNPEAARSLDRALQIFPDHLMAHANLGMILANAEAMRFLESAEYHLNRAMELETDPDRRGNLVTMLRRVAEKMEVARIRENASEDDDGGPGFLGAPADEP